MSVKKRIFHDDQGEELFFSDPNYDFEPKRVKDFHIFFNLVNFYQAIWDYQSMEYHKHNFLSWLNELAEVIISKSKKSPLVSGFLRMMQRILAIANRIDYFGNDLYESNASIYNNVYYYLSSIIRKAQQSSGELQIACLELLFNTPERMLCALIGDMIPAFRIAFSIGKTTLSLVDMAFDTIERYMASSDYSSNETKELLCAVLPYFDIYLQGRYIPHV